MIRPTLRLLAAALLSAAAPFAFTPHTAQAQDIGHLNCHYHEPNAEPREHVLDIRSLELRVEFDAPAGSVTGQATYEYLVLRQRVDSIVFDAIAIDIESVTLNGQRIEFTLGPETVTLYPTAALEWGETGKLVFTYSATPRKGLYFVGWNDPKNKSRKQIWTQGQATDHRHWIPSYDDPNDKLITETIITFESSYEVLSNGKLVGQTDNGDGTTTWHYTMEKPHSLYLLMLGIGQYGIEERITKTNVPVALWYYPDHADRVQRTYEYSTECIEFLEDMTGVPYQWGRYSQIPVQDYMYGAMENTSATVFGDFFMVDNRTYYDRNYVNVNVHELAHQWFGDLITARSFKHLWLQESFATFYPKLFERKVYGEEYYQWRRRTEHNAALDAAKKDHFPIVSLSGGTARIYPKGSAVLDMMMYVFGQEQFNRVIHHYLKKHMFGLVETNDLYQSFQDTLGLSPDWFFDQWLYRGGEPHYQVSYQDETVGSQRQTRFTVKQIHEQTSLVGLFRMPILFQVYYTDNSYDEAYVEIDQQTENVVVPNPGGKTIAYTLFDPGSYILKQVTFDKSFEELKAQALNAPNMIDRYDAVVGLRKFPLEQKRALLAQVFDKETFQYVKTEVIAQLVNDGGNATSVAVIQKAVADPAHEVRRACIDNVKTIPLALRPSFEKLLTDASTITATTALDKLCYQFPANAKKYLKTTANDFGLGGNIRAKWLEISYQLAGDKKAATQLVDLVSQSYEFRTRQSAMQALERINHWDETLMLNLTNALFSQNTRLSGQAQITLKHFYKQVGPKQTIDNYYRDGDWLPWQQTQVNNIIGK